MAKETIKRTIRRKQNGVCDLTKVPLPEETELFDTDRKVPKAEGGIYTDDNTRVVDPVAHMARHGNLRIRPLELENLKALIDDREQVMKLVFKLQNQIRAYKRNTDHLNNVTLKFLEQKLTEMQPEERKRRKAIEEYVKGLDNSLALRALEVKAVGPLTVGYCLVYIDVEKARHASSVWKYAGLHCPSHKRYIKGQASGGNKRLRTALYRFADTQIKHRGPYRVVYDSVKRRLSCSDQLVESRNTEGKMIVIKWCDTKPCHRHGAAVRAMMKHFLADWWWVGRKLLGLDVGPCYAEAISGNGHRTIYPWLRGWPVEDLRG